MVPRVSIAMLVQRNAPQAIAAVRSLAAATLKGVPFETIVLLNGADDRTATAVLRGCAEARVEVSSANLGFAGGCNWIAERTASEYIVFLNDDVLVDPGWLDALVEAADSDAAIGAVGSRLRFPDGTLQEAGSIVWSSGRTTSVGRGEPAAGPTWRARRDVTYCSACALLVRRADFEAVGGFDEAYYPAYYEDVDLCLALGRLGKRIVFEPRAELVHYESQSSTSSFKAFLFERNHRRFLAKWRRVLEANFERHENDSPGSILRAIRRARGERVSVLIVDDQLPDPGLGSGYGRTSELVHDLSSPYYAVKMWATNCAVPDPAKVGALEVEVVTRPIYDEFADPDQNFDIVIVSRPHNYAFVAELLERFAPACRVCYDVESLFFRRLEKQAEIETDETKRAAIEAEAADGRTLEFDIASKVDRLVTISRDERSVLQSAPNHAPIDYMLPLTRGVRIGSQSFDEREQLAVFVSGWMAGATSPNADGFLWFCSEVLPRIRRRLPLFRVVATGGSPPENIRALESSAVSIAGFVADLPRLYGRARIAISPLRFGAGVKIKTIEAIQHGVPVVATAVGAEGLDIANARALQVTDDPETFARAVVELVSSREVWDQHRAAVVAQVETWAATPSTNWDDVCRSMLRTALRPRFPARSATF